MSNDITVKISELPSALTAVGSEVFPVVQSGATRKMTLLQMLALGSADLVWQVEQVTVDSLVSGVFTFSAIEYELGADSLIVDVDGVMISEYTETSTTSITVTGSYDPSSVVRVRHLSLSNEAINTPNLGGGGFTVALSSFAGSSESINDAWPLMIASLPGGFAKIAIDKNPNSTDGSWTIESPVQIPSNCELDMGHTLIKWVNQSTVPDTRRVRGMFEAIGAVTADINIADDITAGSSVITLENAASVDVGDYVNIEISNTQDQTQTDNIYPIIFDFAKVLKKGGNIITVSTVIDWPIVLADQTTARVRLVKNADCAKNILVKNVNVLDEGTYVAHNVPPLLTDPVQPDYVIGPLYFQYCDNVHVQNAYGKDLKCPLVQYREYTRCTVDNLYSDRPLAISAGEGYTVQMSRGSHGVQSRCGGYGTRHVTDFTNGYNLFMKDCWDDTPSPTLVSFLLHGRFESKVRMSGLVGNRVGLGAGFGFGNWIKDWSMSNSNVKQLSNRGAVGVCSIKDSVIGFTGGSLYWEKLSLSNVTIEAGDTEWYKETRLTSPRIDNGLFITSGTRFRASLLKGFERVVIDDSSYHQNGGGATNQVTVEDVARFYCGGEHFNCSYKLIGECTELVFPDDARVRLPNQAGNDGAFSASAIESNVLNVVLNGRIQSLVIAATHRPFKFQQGSGIAYLLKLNMSGLRITGNWTGGAQVSTDLECRGAANGCYYEGLSVPTYYDLTGDQRRPWPKAFRSSGNSHTDESRNWDNVNRVFTLSVAVGTVNAESEKGVLLTVPQWMRIENPAYVHACFSGTVLGNVDILAAIRSTPNEFLIRVRNFAAVSQDLGTATIAFTYSVLN